jgi:tartrate dehydrogenase/decarboxylase/D-malate dehydrogenase
MKPFRIALYPGDGIGKEVTAAAQRVLEHTQQQIGGFGLEFQQFDWGCDYYDAHGSVAPSDFLDILRPFDAIFLGAVGFPPRLPDHVTLEPLIRIRQAFDLFACVRPARTFPGVSSPLASPGEIDMVVVRENSEGEYVSVGGNLRSNQPGQVAIQTAIHTRLGIERILQFSFELARTRRSKLAMITKSNAQQYSYLLWDQILQRMSNDFPDVRTERLHVDAATVHFVQRPADFDVVVASNLFGDILSDLSGAITGSLGLNPSANLDPTRIYPSLFEPVHGSAPDIAGQGIANPVGAILAAAMMIEWLGQTEAAQQIRDGVETALAGGAATPDLAGPLNTHEMTELIVQAMRSVNPRSEKTARAADNSP